MLPHPPQPQFHPDFSYPCPSCRLGTVSQMSMMDTWGCSFCGQLFEGNYSAQSLRTVDQSITLIWYWNRQQWHRQAEPDLQPYGLWQGLSILLVILPTLLVGTCAYLFPTEPDSFLHELPVVWTGLTCLAHLILVLYLVTEYYQIPFTAYRQAILRFWLRHRA